MVDQKSLTVPMSQNELHVAMLQLLDNLHTLHICIRTHNATFQRSYTYSEFHGAILRKENNYSPVRLRFRIKEYYGILRSGL